MKKIYTHVWAFLGTVLMAGSVSAQIGFDPQIDFEMVPDQVIVPMSPIQKQVIFVGGHDTVQTTATYGNPAGAYPAKQWHDFIGFTPDLTPGTLDLGWVSVNHEMITSDPNIGDGGGMTVFKIRRVGDSIVVVDQTLTDGRAGKFFNVDFANTVGETGMNCGGIVSEVDGRIWSAEEWFRENNASIFANAEGVVGAGVLDTMDFTISNSGIPMANGHTIKKYENFNWMVEIDPKEAMAIRKQYNWGRQPFEGGVVMPDNKTVYTGADNTPGVLSKFVADNAGDFTSGKIYAYRQDDQYLRLSHQATFENASSEISAYDEVNNRIYSTNTALGGLTVLEFVNPSTIDSIGFIDLSAYGTPTSVTAKNGIVAVAVPNVVTQNNGVVLFYDVAYNLLNTVTVGALPDMLTFTPDGSKVIVANEGEPSADYTVDPDGSVSVIDISTGVANATVQSAVFTGYTTAMYPNVRVYGNGTTNFAADMEPEYVAVNQASTKAYITLQENNAVAVLDIATATFDTIIALGYKDYGAAGNEIDASDQDNIKGNLQAWNNVYGMYLPDAIAITNINGTEYLITSNEGDSRDYSGYSEEARVNSLTLDPTAFPNAATIQANNQLGRLKVTTSQGDTDGDGDYDELYSYGARSFSIWDLSGNLVYDSGNEIAKMIATRFNGNYPADRDDDKGTEPESVTVGVVAGKTFAFIGLERAAGVMVFDISNPMSPTYVNYFNKNGVDLSPEGLVFVDATNSPTGLPYLISTNEVVGNYNGSVSVYNVNGYDGSNWIEIDNGRLEKMLSFQEEAVNAGATMFNRLEWVAYNAEDGNVYITETGLDKPGNTWKDEMYRGGVFATHHTARAASQSTTEISSTYVDYYGRILKLNPTTNEVTVTLEGGPSFSTADVTMSNYPETHLSNPDGLTFMNVNGQSYMVICEDLNGTSYGRMPAGISNRSCELFILDMSIANPTLDDLVRIAQVPYGAEVTGVRATPDGKTLFFNCQHPSTSNPFPYNNSCTIALSGWDYISQADLDELKNDNSAFSLYPNPTSRIVYFSKTMDVALYDNQGKLIRVERNTNQLDIIGLTPGAYYVKNNEGQTKKLIIQ